jgi:hypothetical protein
MTQLPFPDDLRVDRAKVVDYLLSASNGRGKAAFFTRYGFNPVAWEVLAEALKEQARRYPVATAVDSVYGTRYSVDGGINTPSRREPRPYVRTVWILESGSSQPRLITAHPI